MVFQSYSSPSAVALDRFVDEQLPCDPFYFAVKIGILPFLNKKVVYQPNQQKEGTKSENGQVLGTSYGIKITFNPDSSLDILAPDTLQKFQRWFSGAKREDLGLIHPHLVKFIRCFDPQKKENQTILKACKKGIQVLINTYNKNLELIVTPNAANANAPKETIKIVVSDQPKEIKLLLRDLQGDIDLIDEAIREKTETDQGTFTAKLTLLNEENFPSHLKWTQEVTTINDKQYHISAENYPNNFRVSKEVKTIDAIVEEKIKLRWANQEAVEAIARFFESAERSPDNNLNIAESLLALVAGIPAKHQSMKLEGHKFVKLALADSTVTIENPEKKDG